MSGGVPGQGRLEIYTSHILAQSQVDCLLPQQLMGPSLTAAEKAEVAPEGHMGSKHQGEDSKDTVLMHCVMFPTHTETA